MDSPGRIRRHSYRDSDNSGVKIPNDERALFLICSREIFTARRWTLRPDLTDSSQREGGIQMANKIGTLIAVLLLAFAAPGSSEAANKYCTGHRGICGCSGANDRCCDGAISSARCDPKDTPPWNRPMQWMELIPAMKEMGAPPIIDPAHWSRSPIAII